MVKFSPEDDEYSTTKKARVCAPVDAPFPFPLPTKEAETTSLEMGKSTYASIDPETLDCSICMEPLSPPVFQCSNGHIACSCCCEQLHNKCHSCANSIGKIRCLAIEKVIESVKVGCKYFHNGCTEMIRYSERPDHESKCMYAPYLCPVSGCIFSCPSQQFSNHFTSVHGASLVKFDYDAWFTVKMDTDEQFCILEGEEMIFLLQNKMKPLGNLVHVIYFGPSILEERYSYQIEVENLGRRLTMKSFPRSIVGVHEIPQDFLLVPVETYEVNGHLVFEMSFHRL